MLKTSDILDEKDKRIRAKNVDVEFPMNKNEKKLIYDMLEHLRLSQIEKYAIIWVHLVEDYKGG